MNMHIPITQLHVGLTFSDDTIPVGRLATRNGIIYFEYAADFLNRNLHLSPLKLPLEPGLKTFDPYVFDGLPGVCNDSLPDGWGRLLLDRLLRTKNLLPSEFGPLDRLAHVGNSGLGALTYQPDMSEAPSSSHLNLDTLAHQTQEVLRGEADAVLSELLVLNGSSAGARPKALIGVDSAQKQIVHGQYALPAGYEHWLVKFPNVTDGADGGAIEYVYALMAKAAGIPMSEIHLFPAVHGSGYFATRRFDRQGTQRLHMHTASGLLHHDFRVPSLDYENLLTLTEVLTRDVREVEKMFRMAVFNVLAHNRDDHGKNFTFLMNADGEWSLSPAYDLTFSSGPRGEQSTLVMGEGKNPSVRQLTALGLEAKIPRATINQIIEQTKAALQEWPTIAKHHGVSAANSTFIGSRIVD